MGSFFHYLFANRKTGVPLRDGWIARWHQGEVIELVRGDYCIGFDLDVVRKGLFGGTRSRKIIDPNFVWQPPHRHEVIDEETRTYLVSLVREAVEFEREELIVD